MESIKVDNKFVDQYWNPGGAPSKLHKNYAIALDVTHHIRFHFDGYFMKPNMAGGTNTNMDPKTNNPYFIMLIDSQRPAESDQIRLWRRNMYRPVTKVPCNKVVSSLKKIVKSSDWKIDYSAAEAFAGISPKLGLEDYCEKSFPIDDSIENWAYKNLVRWMLIDPNAICCVMPMSFDVSEGELLKPYPYIITCKDVYDYKQGEYFVFLSPYTTTYTNGKGEKETGQILIVVTNTQFVEVKQVSRNKFQIFEHDHNLGHCPAWLLGGENKTPDPTQPYFESFIQGMLPSLDMAAMDVSDLLAEKIQHVHSTFWSIQGQYCNACQGSGQVLVKGGQTIKQDCPDCGGRGATALSPFRNIEVNLNNALAAQKDIPFPPAGYIEKDKDMVKLMREEIETEVHDALAAINMEFLANTPLSQSGDAKQVDRDELNNFVYGIAYHLIEEIIKPVYYFINEIRYGLAIQNEEAREKQLPKIPVPENFDFLTDKGADDSLVKISGSSVSSGIKDAAEMDYIHKKFADNPEVRNRLLLVHDHDPLPGLEITAINTLIMGGLVPKIDGILSTYISYFVTEILSEDSAEDFINMDYDKQRDKLYEMAQKKMDELDAQNSTAQEAEVVVKDAEGNVIPNPTPQQKLQAKKDAVAAKAKPAPGAK